MYRPEGWPEFKAKQMEGIPEILGGNRDFFIEAGADAIINALKAEGVFTYGNHTPDIELDDAPEVSGYWCFIPEEE